MNFFNLKTITFSLCILSLSFIMVSCAQQEDEATPVSEVNVEETTQSSEIASALLLPEDLFEKGETAIVAYLQDAPADEINLYTKNFKVAKYFAAQNLVNDVYETEAHGFNFSEIDFNKYLSPEKAQELNDLITNSASTRNPCLVTYWNGWEWICLRNWCTGGGC